MRSSTQAGRRGKGRQSKREWRASLPEAQGHHPHGVNIRKQVGLTCWGKDLASPFELETVVRLYAGWHLQTWLSFHTINFGDFINSHYLPEKILPNSLSFLAL